MRVTTLTTLRTGKPGSFEAVVPGETIELPDTEAQSLITRGLVIAKHEVIDQDNDLIDAILDAIDDLPQEAYGKDGKPSVRSIEEILTQSVTAADRDRAWETYQSLVNDGQ